MLDVESLTKSLRLSCLKRIIGDNLSALKNVLKDFGGLMLFKFNYCVMDLQITSTF